MNFYLTVGFGFIIILTFYFFSFQIQRVLAKFLHIIGESAGRFAKSTELSVQRYVFMHRGSLFTKFYNFLNIQIITLGLKSDGVTPTGFLLFWAVLAVLVSFFLIFALSLSVGLLGFLFCIVLTFELILIRVSISEKMEKREECVMDAIDLIIPDLSRGVKNAIVIHTDQYKDSVRQDFIDFEVNLNKRKLTFEESMILLSDSLGVLFRDFAQKAIQYERSGDPEMLDIFSETIDSNALRRELRDVNNKKFSDNKTEFVISTVMLIAYGLFSVVTNATVRNILFQTDFGKVLVLIMVTITLGVLAYISTLKSKPY